MMSAFDLIKRGDRILRANSPAILTALGVSGTIYTAYLAQKAGREAQQRLDMEGTRAQWPLSNKEKFEVVWDLYIPPALAGVITIGCIVGANRVSSKRIAAAYSLVTVGEKAFEEYREKVKEQIGENKEQKIRDEVAQERVAQASSGVVIFESGEVLCFESLTGRYFTSSMEKLRRSENEINKMLLREGYVALNDFYYLVGIDSTDNSSYTGWQGDKLLELEFSSTISNGNTPCLVVSYNYIRPI